jgi:hypothetical protein
MSDLDLAILGSAKLTEESVPVWQASVEAANDNDDTDALGEIDVFQSLGVSSLPFPKDDRGSAQAIVARNVGGKNGVVIGARDKRCAKIVGNLKPGDTVLHSTDAQLAAQVQCKGEKRQVVCATKDTQDKTAAVVLDGLNDKYTVAVFGHLFEISRENGFSFVHESGNGITIGPEGTRIIGPILHAGIPPGMALVAALPQPQVVGPLTNPLAPVLGSGS